MVTDMTMAISIRFADLGDEVKFTEIANLRHWPLVELKGNNILAIQKNKMIYNVLYVNKNLIIM